jgi:GH24 family phage-related lysozyme (muramidase)
MVQRNTQEFQLQQQGVRISQATNLGPGKVQDSDYTGPSIATQALDGLLSVGQQVLGKGIQQEAQNSYLEGRRARMAGQAQEEVQGNIFSRPFVNGGYQDEDYRIEQANMAREMQELIATSGQSMDPTEFGKLVQQRASKYTDKFSSMSEHGQLEAMTSQEAMERSLFTKQAGAYQKWSIDEGAKRFLSQGNQIITDLAASSGDHVLYAQNTERAALLYRDLATNPKLPAEMREKISSQYLGALIGADQRGVVETLRDGGFLNNMAFDDRKTLDAAMRESRTRTSATDNLSLVEQNSQFEYNVGTGNVTAEELDAHITNETLGGRMTTKQAMALRTSYLKGMANQDDQQALLAAVGNRDLSGLAKLGYTGAEGIEAMDKQLAKNGVPLPKRIETGMSVGLDLGQLPKSFGDTIGQAVRAVAANPDGQPLSGDLVETLNAVTGTLTINEQKNPGARAVLLGAMPEDTKATMAYVLRQQDNGVPAAQAIKEFAINKDAFAKLDALEQGMRTQKFRKSLYDKVESLSTSNIANKAGNLFRGESNLSANPYHQVALAGALTDELANITSNRDNMGLNEDAALDLAVANVQARTITVGEKGVLFTGEDRRGLILPRGVQVEQVFGSSNKAMIGKLLSEEYPKAADGFESTFSFNRATGKLENLQIDTTGRVLQRTPVDPQAIGKKINDEQARILDQARQAHFGADIDMGGQPFKVDGGNSYGIPVRQAYEFRKELTGMEGLRLEVYKDRNGLAVGVGRNVTGQMKEGDKITREQAEKWFREDSDKAMQQGTQIGRQLGVRDPGALAGLSGAVFQLGADGLAKHTKTADAIRTQDWNAFVSEVRSSDWAKQTPERTEWFIKRMAPHFSGTRITE